jgi:hypothetical protein
MKDNPLPLEQRIALWATDITSTDLAALIVDVEAAAKAADENATKAREQALDPGVVVDTAKVGAAVATARSLHAPAYKLGCPGYACATSRYASRKISPSGKRRPPRFRSAAPYWGRSSGRTILS